MIRALILLVLFSLCACDFDGPFNQIPCRYNLDKLHDTLKEYGLSSWNGEPKGFMSKHVYNISDLDTSSWNISLTIDSPNNLFFDESFVAMLARKVFDDSSNRYFQHISFQLKQVIDPISQGSVELNYFIDRNTNAIVLKNIPTATNIQIPRKRGEGYASAGQYGTWKIVTLEIDSIPKDAYQIATLYRQNHAEYQDIEIYVNHVPSKICKRVKYTFWFGNEIQVHNPN